MAKIVNCKTHHFPHPHDAKPRYIIETEFLRGYDDGQGDYRICFQHKPNFPEVEGSSNQPTEHCKLPLTGLWWWASRIVSYHTTEAGAVTECDRLNSELEQ